MVKFWKCPNCARENITEDKVLSCLCPCGEYYYEVIREGEEDE